MHKRNGSRGVTLIELCVAMAVVALLAGLAAPDFRAALRSSAVRSATFELLAGLQQARAGSILESRTGVLCLSDAEGTCLAGGVAAPAWHVYLEVDGRPVSLASHPLPPGITLRSSRSQLRFWPDSLSASTGTLTICDSTRIARPRAIVISQNGRPRLTPGADSACR